jgi:hypothetical protein
VLLARLAHFLALAYVIAHSGVTTPFRLTPIFALIGGLLP